LVHPWPTTICKQTRNQHYHCYSNKKLQYIGFKIHANFSVQMTFHIHVPVNILITVSFQI
jgi:hypothetical protein